MDEARLFMNGKSQAVRLPKEFRFRGTAVFIRRIGDTVILLPKKNPWSSLINACRHFTPDFLADRDQGRQERDIPFT